MYPDRVLFVLGSNTLAAVALDDLGKVDGQYLSITFNLVYQ